MIVIKDFKNMMLKDLRIAKQFSFNRVSVISAQKRVAVIETVRNS